jgi:hypothetical protein
LEETENCVSAAEGPSHALFIAHVLGHVVSQDDDSAARLGSSFPLHVGCGIQQGICNVSAAIETFMAHDPFQLVAQLIAILQERHSNPRRRIENHDCEAIVTSQYSHRFVRRVRNSLDMWPHTPADVEQEQNIDRHVFAGEITDLLRAPLRNQDEIVRSQPANRAIVVIHNLRVDPDKGHIAAEDQSVVVRWKQGSGGQRE